METSMTSENSASTYKFLLVDDSRAIQSIIRRALESCEYENLEVRIAGDGETAMEILNDFKPDMIITDWHMPKMSGLEFCQQVRQVHGEEILIGFVTTESSQEKIIQAHHNGASFVIIKPFTDTDLCATVLKHLPKERTHNDKKIIIDVEKCKEILAKYFVNQPFNLIQSEPITLPDLTDNNLIGLYGFNGKPHPVVAIAIMDMKSVGMLWGAAEQKNIQIVKNQISSNEFKEDQVACAQDFMRKISTIVNMPEGNDPIGLSRSNVLSRSFPKLQTVLEANSGRSDFKIEVPELGAGIISFILV